MCRPKVWSGKCARLVSSLAQDGLDRAACLPDGLVRVAGHDSGVVIGTETALFSARGIGV